MAFHLLKPKPSPLPLFLHHHQLLPKYLCTQPQPCDELTIQESNLLDNLSSLLKSFHQTSNPHPPQSLDGENLIPPTLTIPSLSTSLSQLCPTPLPPHIPLHLLRRISSPLHTPSIPFSPALSFFNWWLSTAAISSPSSPPVSDTFVELIDLAGRVGHFNICWHLIDTLRSHQIPVPKLAFFSLIRRYGRANLPDDAISAFRRMPDFSIPQTPHDFSLLISALSRPRLALQAQSVFDEFKSQFPPDVVTYSSLIHAWCRAGNIEKAEKVFLEMKAEGVEPNVYTYTVVIDALSRAGQVPRAQEVLCQMIDRGCQPNAATFNVLLRAHVKAGRPAEQALQLHNQMKQLSVEPDIITYNFLIQVHCRKGQRNLDAALKVLNSMVSKGCSPNVNSFNPIFRCVLELGDVGAANKLYDRMREVECKPNTVTYNLLMELFGKDKKSIDMVMRMKKEMDEEGVEPNVNTYKVLITAFCGRGHWKKAYQLLKEMVEEKSFRPTVPVYEMVLGLLRKAGQLKKHGELVEKMAERGFLVRSL